MATHQESGQLNLVQSYELQNYVAVELVALSNTVAGFQPSKWAWTVPPDSCSISSVATPRSLRLLETLVHMVATYARGSNPARTLSRLSTWLGHTSPDTPTGI